MTQTVAFPATSGAPPAKPAPSCYRPTDLGLHNAESSFLPGALLDHPAHHDGELWHVYLDSGTVHLGRRVLITSPDKNRSQWKSVSDKVFHSQPEAIAEEIRHRLEFEVEQAALPGAVPFDPLGERILERGRDAHAGAVGGLLEPVDQIRRD